MGLLQLRLSDYDFMAFEYGKTVTFRLYNSDGSVFNANGYTADIVITNSDNEQILDNFSPSFTDQPNGVGTFSFTESKRLTNPFDIYFIQVILTKAGEVRPSETVRISCLQSGIKA